MSQSTHGNPAGGPSAELDRDDLLAAILSRERFLETILGSLESFVTVDRDWRLTFVNDAAATLVHAGRDDLIGADLLDLLSPDTREHASSWLRKAMTERASVEFEIASKNAGRQYQVKAYPLADGGLAVYLHDISERVRAERALRESEQRLRFHLENTPLAVVEWDADFVVTHWAGEAEAMFGWPASETVGKPILDLGLIHADDTAIVERTMARLSSGDHTQVVASNRNVTRDGRVIDCTWHNSVLLDEQGRMSSVMSLVLDRTEHLRALEAVRASEERQTFLLELSDALRPLDDVSTVLEASNHLLGRYLKADRCGLLEVDAAGDYVTIADDWTAPGVSPLPRLRRIDEFGGRLAAALRRGETIVVHDAHTSELTRTAEVTAAFDAVQARAGILCPLLRQERLAAALFVHTAGPRGWTDDEVALVAEVAARVWPAVERARAEAALLERAAEEAAQKERVRLARDLHDSVTQSLFAATLKAEALALSDGAPAAMVAGVEDVGRLNRGALAQMRTLLLELRGESLEEVPLEQLMGYLVEATEGRASTGVHLTVRGTSTLPAEVHKLVYRITQEALNNVVRHARAGNAWITLELETPRGVRLTVEDDGCGFDPGQVGAASLGLRSMRERAVDAGARLDLVTEVGGGTVVRLVWRED